MGWPGCCTASRARLRMTLDQLAAVVPGALPPSAYQRIQLRQYGHRHSAGGGRSVVACVLGDHGTDGHRTVMTTESCSACHEWSMPGPQVT